MSQPRPVPTFARSLTQAALTLLCGTALGIAACGGGGGGGSSGATTEQPASSTGKTTVLGAALTEPWGLAFLPEGRMLVSEKGGTLRVLSADGSNVVASLDGPPGVTTGNQGGLLDVAVDPADPRSVYMTFSELGNGVAGTALARGQLNASYDGWQQSPQVIWQQQPKVQGGIHYGSRIAFRNDGTLYVTAGERGVENTSGTARSDALGVQNADNTIGKVVHLKRDGSPADGSALGIWSSGHRNPQGAAVRPGTNELWITEHGPQGGDELNFVTAGGNYGWPVKSYGCPYDDSKPKDEACRIGGGTHTGYTEPISYWVPISTAPSGLMFYNGDQFPDWKGSLFSGALAGTTLWRLAVDGNNNVTREEVAAVKALGVRIRDVRQGPDGNIYLLTNGSGANANRVVRLAP
jgi:aldose sugar dehydrogenase